MDKNQEIERSIITTYRAKIWSKFVAAIQEYELIKDGDKIAVCISGGKDSTLLAKCMQELKKHGKNNFEVVYLVMDPGYNEVNRQLIIDNCKLLDIPLEIFKSNIFDAVAAIEESPCYLCARMRRGYLYKNAQALGCNKIALGHHYDDVIETILMGMFYNGQIQTMMPKLHSNNYEGMELIRPLYHVREQDIIAWKNHSDLHFLQCACRFTESCTICDAGGGSSSKRLETKNLIKRLRQVNDKIDMNIFKSVYNVKLNKIIGYNVNGVKHSFLDDYNKTEKNDEEE